jgi:PAS domain S-box-containing protein
MANMLGYTVEEMLGRHLYSFMTSDAIELAKENLKRREQGIEENHDFQFIRKDGAKIYTNIETSPIMDDDGNYKGAIALVSDITKRRQMEVKLKNSVKEKEMLLKEIHHRVKNNLMVISSLLNLQSQYIKDKEALNIFKESQSRARSMALIHELLYKSTDLKRINFGDYIRTLSSELLRTYSTGNILLNLFVEDLMLDINTTVPLGLIVNELVSNSLKHAFPQGQEGNIVINFHKSKEKYILIVKDDGVGFPEEVDYKNSDTLGLQIVNSLTGQIDGVISLEKGKGTKFTLKLREEAYY